MHIPSSNNHLANTALQPVTNEASTVGQGLRAVGQGLQSVGQTVGNGTMTALQATGNGAMTALKATGNAAKSTLLALLSPIAGNTPGGVGGAPLAGMAPWIARSVQRNNEHPSAIDLREQTAARTKRGCVATAIQQGVIITIADSLGRIPAEYMKIAIQTGNYQNALAYQCTLAAYHAATLAVGLVRNLSLSEGKKLAAVAAHFGKSPEEISAFCQVYRHRDKRSVTQGRVRQHLTENESGALHRPARGEVDPARTLKILNNMRMRDTAAYMAAPLVQDVVALTMTLKAQDRRAAGLPPDPIIDNLGAAMTKSAFRNAIYAPLREAAQQLWGVKTGDANLNHTESLECGIRYFFNQGVVGHLQDTGFRLATGLPTLLNSNAWTLQSPQVKTDLQRVGVLTFMSAINALGEIVNGIDDNLMRAQRAQRQAVIDLRLQHQRAGSPAPTEAQENAVMRPHIFGGDSLSDSFTTAEITGETFKNISGRLIGSVQMRHGLLSMAGTAGYFISHVLNHTDNAFLKSNSHPRSLMESSLVSLFIAGGLYIKFNANAQSLASIRNNVEAEPLVPHPQIEELPDLEIGPLDGDRPIYPLHAEIERQEPQRPEGVEVRLSLSSSEEGSESGLASGPSRTLVSSAEIELAELYVGDLDDLSRSELPVAIPVNADLLRPAIAALPQRQPEIQENVDPGLSRSSSEGSESGLLNNNIGSELGDPDLYGSTRTNFSVDTETGEVFFKRART